MIKKTFKAGMEHLNSRERVIAAIEHKGPDRVPYDFWAENATIERIYKKVQYRDFERLLEELHVDMRHVNAEIPKEKNCGKFFQNYWGERYVYRQTQWGLVREDLPGALSDARSFQDLKEFDWPTPELFDYSNLYNLCRTHSRYAIMYGFADIWQRPALVRGMENALMDLIVNPEWAHFLSRKFTDFYIEDYTRAYRHSGKRIDIFLIISDLGGQNGPMISIEMFDDFIAPYLKEMTDHIHNLGAYVMFHSCGMVLPYIERLIDIGIDILDPIQPVCSEMQPENLAKKYKKKICFHGGIDIQKILPFGEPVDVKTEVRRYAEILGKGGGYICCPAHLFQPDIPPGNIFAFYDALV